MSYCTARVGEYLPTGAVGVHACGVAGKHKSLVLGATRLELHQCDRDGCGIIWFDSVRPAPAPLVAPLTTAEFDKLLLAALERMSAGKVLRRPRRKRRRA